MYRPSGLTALAIFNFVFSGLALLLRLLPSVLIASAGQTPDGKPVDTTFLGLTALYLAVDIALMVTAGVGYLKMKRVLGRWLGTIEAVFSLAYFVAAVIYIQTQKDAVFTFSQLNSLVYPALTLMLLNVVFRENLVN